MERGVFEAWSRRYCVNFALIPPSLGLTQRGSVTDPVTRRAGFTEASRHIDCPSTQRATPNGHARLTPRQHKPYTSLLLTEGNNHIVITVTERSSSTPADTSVARRTHHHARGEP